MRTYQTKEAKIREIIESYKKQYPSKTNSSNRVSEKEEVRIKKVVEECSPILADNLENFFNNSKVGSFFERFDIKKHDSFTVDYDGRNYIRVMKLFSLPESEQILGERCVYGYSKCKDGKKLWKAVKEDFHLRFYLPKSVIGTVGKKFERIVIMINGMNEDDSFHLYDILGEFFANNGMAAVLLPTPLHLNRRITARGQPHKISKCKKPVVWAYDGNPELFYLNYIQGYKELKYLLNKIRCNDDFEGKETDFDFYNNYFANEKTKVTILGYSLGGLKALGFFLNEFKPDIKLEKKVEEFITKYETEKNTNLGEVFKSLTAQLNGNVSMDIIDSCITINSGPNLIDINIDERITGLQGKEHWKEVLGKMHERLTINESEINQNDELRTLIEYFKFLYFFDNRDYKSITSNNAGLKSLERSLDNFMAISGGSDTFVGVGFGNISKQLSIISKKKVETSILEDNLQAGALNQLIIAKGDHHPSLENSNWPEMLPVAAKTIINFINSCGEKQYVRSSVVGILKEILIRSEGFESVLKRCKQSFHRSDYDAILEGFKSRGIHKELKILFEYFFYRSKAFYPNFPEVIVKIGELIERQSEKDRTKKFLNQKSGNVKR